MKKQPTILKKMIVLVMLFASWQMVQAQVTTGSMAGVVRSAGGETLPGATVIATHVPTGTTYGTTTSTTGNYNLQGMRAGGPYTLQVSFMGFQTQTIEDITVQLGEAVNINFVLGEGATTLTGVTIAGERSTAFNTVRTGATTNVSNTQINRLPTLSRNLTDVSKLSPFSSGSNSFVGRESFATNITIDGANFNNNFGLSGGGMPGVTGDPISMDAIEELQVVVAPFDVRQSNFTGAGINAVTKSGSNTVTGTLYGYFSNQNMGGKKIRGNEISNIPETKKQIFGFSAGAPIIKNKLFIFLNGEISNDLRPGNTLLAMAPGRDPSDPNVSTTVQASDLQAFSDYLKTQFGYVTGPYEKWGGDNVSNNKMLARLDWNVNNNHKVTVRYNYSKSSNLFRPSTSGDGGGAINPGRHNRTGGMSFENSQYSNDGIMHSITGELNSRLSNELSNNFLIAYTNYDQPRSTGSERFPMVDIMRGDPAGSNSYMSAGYELFSWQNRVQNNTLVITNNATYQHGAHTFTAGVSFDYQYFSNSYLRNGTGYYRYRDFDAFKAHVRGDGAGLPYNPDYHPIGFAYTYPINDLTEPKSELSFGQLALYVQDEWSVRDNLKLTMGLRLDLPMYLDDPVSNPDVIGQKFKDGQEIDLSTWPKVKPLFSPRLGFNWDVNKDRSLTVRGGTGLFTGRIPFVWFTNQPGNSGMLQYQISLAHGQVAQRDILARIPFEADTRNLLTRPEIKDIFPDKNQLRGNRLAVIDKDFKLPQVWRTSLASDIRLPLNMMLTLEGVFSKDIHAVHFQNINVTDPDGWLIEGSGKREFYITPMANINTNVNADVVRMTNTNKGYGVSLSAQLRLPHWNGLSGDIAYTYNHAKEVAARTNGSDPFAAYNNRQSLNTLNTTELALSLMNTPHRIMASASYYVEYAKHFATTISLFYSGRTGSAYSYLYNGRPVGTGFGGSSYLAYLPKNKDEVIWDTEADWTAYQAFVKNNPSIEKHLGGYAPKYGSYLPWTNRIDLRIAQEFKIKVGNVTNKLEFSADIINFGNMLNSEWGISDDLNGSFAGFPILSFRRRDAATGKAVVAMNGTGSGASFQPHTSVTRAPGSQAATWALQFGVRYTF